MHEHAGLARLGAVLLVLWTALALAAQARALEPGRAEHGTLEKVEGVYVLRLWGTPRERGRAHAMLAGRDLMVMLEAAFRTGVLSAETYERKVLPMVRSLFRWPAHVEEELRGFLEGLEASLGEKDRTLGALDRTVTLDDLHALNALGDWRPFACSTLSAWGEATSDGRTVAGRNFDYLLPPAMITRQLILAQTAADGRLAFHTVSFPGIIGGITCLNEQGVFAAIHDVHVRPKKAPPASSLTPRLIALRLLAETAEADKALEQAVLLCREHRSLYGNNFHVALPRNRAGGPRAGVIEYDSRVEQDHGATLRLPGDRPFLLNTNHYRRRDEPRPCSRYQAIEETFRLLRAQAVTLDRKDAMQALISAGEVRMTLHQVLAWPGTRTVAVAFQERPFVTASRHGFHVLKWSDVFP